MGRGIKAMIRWLVVLWRIVAGRPDPYTPDPDLADGFGQSAADDLRFRRLFRTYRRQRAVFRRPTRAEAQAHDAHPIVGRFGDGTIAIARQGPETWIVRDRMWHGWPDPPEFAFFALAGGTVTCAVDFSSWPAAWVRED